MADVIKFEDGVKAFERDKKVIQLLIAGVQARRIAEELGISVQEVQAAHHRMMGAVPQDYRARHQQLHIERCEAVVRTFFPKMLSGDTEATKVMLRAMRESAQVLGIYPLPSRDDAMDELKNQETTTEQITRLLDEIQGKGKPMIEGEAQHMEEP